MGRQRTQCRFDLATRRCHGGGQQCGRAVAAVHPRDGCDGVAAGHRVVAAAAVHMQVDEAGQQQRQVVRAHDVFADRLALDRSDAPALLHQLTAHKALRREHMALQRGSHAQSPSGSGLSSVGASAGTRKRSLAQAPRSALRQRWLQKGRQGLAGL